MCFCLQHSSSGQVHDLFVDMRDGVLLCHLLEVLTGDVLPVTTASTSNGTSANGFELYCPVFSRILRRCGRGTIKRVYQLNNLSTALKCLRARGLELINNNVIDLADGNPRIWLGLIWQMILHFQVHFALRKWVNMRKNQTKVEYFWHEIREWGNDCLINLRASFLRWRVQSAMCNGQPKGGPSLGRWTKIKSI